MSLADRLRNIESQNASQQREIDLLRTQMTMLLNELAADAEGNDEQVDVTTLDGVRLVGAGPRDQSEPL